ncbi:MAG: pyridoxal-phosphate dependent enzyme [Xanthomonadaceae bacterium]|nr:pyridoxal-phosphate dependent enzyme [Xanthomonadaceae bacterium]
MNRVFDNVLKAIGNTPIVKLNKVPGKCKANVYAKLEYFNPGGSIKDRIGWYLIEDAERKGLLKPGGTIVEGTSGNTGMGLAIAAAIKGYKCTFVLPDKMSIEKIRNLRAFGARVVVTPTAVEPTDPRSYYSVSRRLATETPNSIYLNQYDNLANREAHYNQTGPEILGQMPDIDVFVAGIGTGGTICGTGKYLKEKKPDCQVIAVDPVGSIVHEFFKTGKMLSMPKTYKIEGIGEDFIPKNYDFQYIDDIIQVEDKESFLMTRQLLTREGIYAGVSSGSAVVGALRYIESQGDKLNGKNVLIIICDTGGRYLSKVYDDDWMKEAGFLDTESMGTVTDLMRALGLGQSPIMMAKQTDKVSHVITLMKDKNISQLPVSDDAGFIKGIISEGQVLSALYENKAKPSDTIERLMDPSVEFVKPSDPIEKLMRMVTGTKIPMVMDPTKQDKPIAIITKIDLLSYLGNRS